MLADVSSSARGGRSSAAITCLSPRNCSTRTLIGNPNPYTTVPVFSDAIQRLHALPVLPLPLMPTPVEDLSRLAAGARLLVKRDNAIPFGFGGNKVRQLRLVAAQAIAEGADTLITTGGVQS